MPTFLPIIRLELRLLGYDRPLGELGKHDGLDLTKGYQWSQLHPFDRVFFVPEAHALVILDGTFTTIHIHKVDVYEVLARTGVDYLFVNSRPPAAIPGGTFSYRPVVKSKQGGVTFRLEEGPEGMTVAPDGTITWKVPAGWKHHVGVTLLVSDRSGQEVPHDFTLTPGQRTLSAVAEPNPTPSTPQKTPPPKSDPPKFRIPPVDPVEFKVAPLAMDKVELKLPGKVTDAVVGGSGRYWCLLMPEQKQVAIFDANEAKITKTIPLPNPESRIAAGMNMLLVADSQAGQIIRYNLSTFEKEATADLPFKGRVREIAMGSASAGPALVRYQPPSGSLTPVRLLDVGTFQLLDTGPGDGFAGRVRADSEMRYRASPDNRIIGVWEMGGPTPAPYILTDSQVKTARPPEFGHVFPADDGTLITGGGLVTPDGVKLKGEEGHGVRVPAQLGSFYLCLALQQDNPKLKPVKLYRIGDKEPLATFPDVEMSRWVDIGTLFSPSNGLIAVLSDTGDKLLLHKFDLDAVLQKSGVDYLFALSRPPVAIPGKAFKYQPLVKSKLDGVALSLDTGPTGMKLTPDGVLTWDVPKDWVEPMGVVIALRDKSGANSQHSFVLSPPVAAIAAPTPQAKP